MCWFRVFGGPRAVLLPRWKGIKASWSVVEASWRVLGVARCERIGGMRLYVSHIYLCVLNMWAFADWKPSFIRGNACAYRARRVLITPTWAQQTTFLDNRTVKLQHVVNLHRNAHYTSISLIFCFIWSSTNYKFGVSVSLGRRGPSCCVVGCVLRRLGASLRCLGASWAS